MRKPKQPDTGSFLRGSARAAHFAAGGTPATWRGRAAVLDESTSKHRLNKLACRGRVRDLE